MTWDLLASVVSIVVINVVLSGDNALVIGMASRRLAPRQRRWAIILGGAGAIVLRVLFTAAAVYLLKVPFLQAAGGVLLTWIAFRLLHEDESESEIVAKDSLIASVQTIILADLVMSLDNILAIGGAANGSLELMILGLVLSMPPILFGSSLLARLMNRYPWLTVLGSVVLAITAARMIVDDRLVEKRIHGEMAEIALISLSILLTLVVVVPNWLHRRAVQREKAAGVEGQERDEAVTGARHQADRPIKG